MASAFWKKSVSTQYPQMVMHADSARLGAAAEAAACRAKARRSRFHSTPLTARPDYGSPPRDLLRFQGEFVADVLSHSPEGFQSVASIDIGFDES